MISSTSAVKARFSPRSLLRVAIRFLWLGGEVLLALLDFIINVVFRPKVPLSRARSVWLQQTCRTALRILDVEVRTTGTIPLRGLLICPQPSYLDVLVIGAITPTIFVSRSEIKQWPIFGWFAAMAGTLFVRRERRSEIAQLNREMEQAFEAGHLVALFSEQKQPGHSGIMPFKSSLLEPATRLRQPLCAASLCYSSPDDESTNQRFAPHWLSLLSGPGLLARVDFDGLEPGTRDRKQLARRLRHHLRLRQSSATASVAG